MSSASGIESAHCKGNQDYFDDAELARIRAAALDGPHRLRDGLITSSAICETNGTCIHHFWSAVGCDGWG